MAAEKTVAEKATTEKVVAEQAAAVKEELLARMSPKDRALPVTLRGMLREVVDEAFSSSVT